VSEDRLNMTGMWEGTYVYPAFVGPTTPFVANFVDQDGHVSGSTIEPNNLGIPGEPEELEASLVGNRQGRAVDFTKSYLGWAIEDQIDYVGQLSEDGETITGVWSNADMDGTFEMHRERAWEELASAETSEELPVPAAVPTELPPP